MDFDAFAHHQANIGNILAQQEQTRHDFEVSVTLVRQHANYAYEGVQMCVIATLGFSSFLHSAADLEATGILHAPPGVSASDAAIAIAMRSSVVRWRSC